MYYAQLQDSIVVGVSQVSEAIASPDLIEITSLDASLIGSHYAGGVFTAPVPVATPFAPWTKKQFLLRFTPVEYGAIKAAVLVSHEIDYYWALFTNSDSVDKTDPVTIAGINALEAAGLLAVGRAAGILA